MNKRFLLSILTILLLIPVATAAYSHSFDYTKFNSTTHTWEQLDTTYSTFQATITVSLTWNSTYAGSYAAEIKITDTTNTSTYSGVQIAFDRNKKLYTYWIDNASSTKVDETTLSSYDEPIVVTYNDGKLYVGNSTNYDVYVDGFIAGTATFDYIGAKGDTVLTTAGYVSVELDTAPISLSLDTTLQIIFDVIPLIFTVAVIGIILKMFKDISK